MPVPSIHIEIDPETLTRAEKLREDFPRQIRAALSKALNAGAREARSRIVAIVAEQLGLSKAVSGKRVWRLARASIRNLFAVTKAGTFRWSYKFFSPRPAPGGVQTRLSGQSAFLPGAFVNPAALGHGVFERLGKTWLAPGVRGKIRQLFLPSPTETILGATGEPAVRAVLSAANAPIVEAGAEVAASQSLRDSLSALLTGGPA